MSPGITKCPWDGREQNCPHLRNTAIIVFSLFNDGEILPIPQNDVSDARTEGFLNLGRSKAGLWCLPSWDTSRERWIPRERIIRQVSDPGREVSLARVSLAPSVALTKCADSSLMGGSHHPRLAALGGLQSESPPWNPSLYPLEM